MNIQKPYARTVRACYLAFVSQAIINNLAPLLFVLFHDRYGISFERIGLLIMVNFGVQLVVDALCARFADRIGHRPLIVVAHMLCVMGLVLLALLPGLLPSAYTGLLAATCTYAVGGGLIEVLSSHIVDSLPGDKKASSMSLLHASYCWGHLLVVLLTTGALALLGADRWRVLPLVWAIVPAVNAVCFLRVPLATTSADIEKIPLQRLLATPLFLLSLLLMLCAGASEQAMAQWASLFAERGLHVSKIVGDLLGPCLFAALMGVGRLFFGLYGAKIRPRRALALCALLATGCYLTTSLSPQPIIALLGCALTGFAVSFLWPGMVSLSANSFAGGGTATFSLLAMAGAIGCSLGPWLTGAVSDAAQKSEALLGIGTRAGLDAVQTGLKAGLLAAVVFPVLLLIGIGVMAMATRDRA